jgi:hypothetical protein
VLARVNLEWGPIEPASADFVQQYSAKLAAVDLVIPKDMPWVMDQWKLKIKDAKHPYLQKPHFKS